MLGLELKVLSILCFVVFKFVCFGYSDLILYVDSTCFGDVIWKVTRCLFTSAQQIYSLGN